MCDVWSLSDYLFGDDNLNRKTDENNGKVNWLWHNSNHPKDCPNRSSNCCYSLWSKNANSKTQNDVECWWSDGCSDAVTYNFTFEWQSNYRTQSNQNNQLYHPQFILDNPFYPFLAVTLLMPTKELKAFHRCLHSTLSTTPYALICLRRP